MDDRPTRSEFILAGSTIDQLNRREIEAPLVPDERMYLETCSVCGQVFDGRYLGDALYHATVPDHRPLAGSPEFAWVPVDEAEETLFRWQA